MKANFNLTTLGGCDVCGSVTMWNISHTFSVAMQEGKGLSKNLIRTCQGCGAVEGHDGTTDLS